MMDQTSPYNEIDKNRTMTRRITYVGLALALMIVCARVTIPIPPIQLTLQTFGVSFIALFLGPKLSSLTQSIYLFIGLLGLPVFSQGGGPAYVAKPSFGFIVSFIPASFVTGLIFQALSKRLSERQKQNQKHKQLWLLGSATVAGMAGLFVTYLIGTLYFFALGRLYLSMTQPWTWFAVAGALQFLPKDAASVALAAAAVSTVHVILPKRLRLAL